MNCKLWPALPDEIIFRILVHLPWDAVLRFRAVCVNWNQFLRSREFQTDWKGRDHNQVPLCFISCSKKGTIAFNPARNSWLKCGITSFPIFHTFSSEDGVSYKAKDVHVVGAAHGLLLLKGVPPSDFQKFDLLVINPVDHGVRKRVPLLPEMRQSSRSCPLGMVWNEVTESHQILLCEAIEGQMWTFHSYDVQSNLWEQFARWPTVRTAWVFKYPCMHEGRLYYLGDHHRAVAGKWLRLYRQDADKLGSKGHSRLPPQLHFATLCNVHEEIMLAGGQLESNDENQKYLKDFRVWRLRAGEEEPDPMEIGTTGRTLVHTMPDGILWEFNRAGPHREVICAANDKFLCVVSPGRFAAMLDMKNKSWTTLPPHFYPMKPTRVSFRFAAHPFRGGLSGMHLCEPRVDISLEVRG